MLAVVSSFINALFDHFRAFDVLSEIALYKEYVFL